MTEQSDLLRRINAPVLPDGHGIDTTDGCMRQWFRQPIRNIMNIPVTAVGDYGVFDDLQRLLDK
jgi:hypothetical protein